MLVTCAVEPVYFLIEHYIKCCITKVNGKFGEAAANIHLILNNTVIKSQKRCKSLNLNKISHFLQTVKEKCHGGQ